MPLDMMDSDQRNPPGEGHGLGDRESDQQSAHQTGTAGDNDALDVIERDTSYNFV